MSESKANLSAAIVFLIATAAGVQVPQVKWSKFARYRTTRGCPRQFTRNMSRRRYGIAAGRLWSRQLTRPLRTPPYPCPPSENLPFRVTRHVCAKAGMAKSNFIICTLRRSRITWSHTKIHPSEHILQQGAKFSRFLQEENLHFVHRRVRTMFCTDKSEHMFFA